MHIGFLTFESPFGAKGGGVASYLRAAIPALLDAGHRVTLITANPDGSVPGGYENRLRVIVVSLPNTHWYLSKLPLAREIVTLPVREAEWSVSFQRTAAQAMRDDPMDVLEVTELGAWWLARHPVAPLVVRSHGAEYTFSRYIGAKVSTGSVWSRHLQRQSLSRAAIVTAPSRNHAAEIASEMKWNEDRIAVIPNLLSPLMLRRSADYQPALSADHSRPVILYTGRLAPIKGTSLLLDAAAEVIREYPSAQFILAGPWQMPVHRREWARWQERLGGGDQILWMDQQSPESLAALYQRATVFVMPSFYETFGISCLEAMAFRIPVVATRAGALPEVVENEEVGLIVAPGDRTALSQAILRLLKDPNTRRRMGANGRERVLTGFDTQTICRQMVRTYEYARERAA